MNDFEMYCTSNFSNQDLISPKLEPTEMEDHRLIIGTNDKKKEIYIPESSRYFNSLILGAKGTGKTSKILPAFVSQDLKNKKAGMTVVVTQSEMAYNLYALAKKYKRKVRLLKPSIDNKIAYDFIWQKEYNYDYINENIINYKEAIKRKEIIIIDMEIFKYNINDVDGIRAVSNLLLQLQLDIQETDITQKIPHFLYVDDAYYYLGAIKELLKFSNYYNLGITLFLQSRNQIREYLVSLDANVRTVLLLNSLTLEDVEFYVRRFYEHKNLSNFYTRKAGSVLYETLDKRMERKTGIADCFLLTEEEESEMQLKAKRIRVKLLREKRKQREAELLQKIKEDATTSGKEPIPFDLASLDEEEEMGDKTIKDMVFQEEKEVLNYCKDDFNFKFE